MSEKRSLAPRVARIEVVTVPGSAAATGEEESMSIGRICNRVVVMAGAAESIGAVARRMEEERVGAVVVVGKDMRPVGIVTDRDIALRCTGARIDPETTPIEAVMSRQVQTVDESTPIQQALHAMSRVAHRRLLVTGPEATLVGIVSVDDVMQLVAEEAVYISELLRREGAPARAPGVKFGPVV
jgi:CBS domain-containing protein